MSALWLFLALAELLCPVCGDEHFAAASSIADRNEIVASVCDAGVKETSAENSLPSGSRLKSADDMNICRDECLCHPFLPASIDAIDLKAVAILNEKIRFEYNDDIANPISPPFEPPRKL